MHRHVLQARLCQRRRYLRPSPIVLWVVQGRIQVPRHYQCCALGPLLEHGKDTLYCQGVVGGEVTSNDVPLPRSSR